jgi:type III restriction enzyme
MNNEQYLYEKISVLDEAGMLKEIPEIIYNGLNDNIILREYQEKAFKYFITYYETPTLIMNKQVHNLFQMATGSGKTVIMAGLILYLYSKGYNKFLFFVNQSNIVAKTISNFTDQSSNKYLFNNELEYLGRKIRIKEVNNFDDNIDDTTIEICFTTTQKLHMDLTFSRENSLTFNDFEKNKIVFISDESHHINAVTKNVSDDIKMDIKSWETSVTKAFTRNKDNIMLEFTATADLRDINVKNKYLDKLIFDYDLEKFRDSGYTKDFENFATESDLWDRTLMALILSEYRKYLFAELKQDIKPVVLLKSKTISESKEFYKLFFDKINDIKANDLAKYYDSNIPLLTTALDYFKKKDNTYQLLASSIKSSFTETTARIMNSKEDSNNENEIEINSLEDKNNPVRIIFTVDMLNEGWDVLNLFDIVRLYDTRQGSGKAGKIGSYTIKEAQLIGRGARYCPFDMKDGQDPYRRKFDYDYDNKYRILETMLFHSRNDSRYISELKQALRNTGLLSKEPIKLNYKLKDEFMNSEFYNKAYVYSNKRISTSRDSVTSIEDSFKTKKHVYNIKTNKGNLYDLFSNDQVKNVQTKVELIKFKDIDYNILLGASESFYELKFDILQRRYPKLKSMKEFLTSPNYLGDNEIEINYENKISGYDLLNACKKSLIDIANHIVEIKSDFVGDNEFYPRKLKDVLKDKSIFLSAIDGNGGKGDSQNNCVNPSYQLNLTNEPWYVFNDNYGTSEEKQFIKHFKEYAVPKLQAKNCEFYVIRNERVPELAIYSFNNGERFEPDFLLFIKKETSGKPNVKQVYAEPKGSQLLETDKWKDIFLQQLSTTAFVNSLFDNGNDYKIYGLPFYNEELRKQDFDLAIDSLIQSI